MLEPAGVASVSVNGWSIIGELIEGTAEVRRGAIVEVASVRL